MTPVRTVFLGSGSFAVPILEVLARHPQIDLRAVVTAPPQAAGRGRKVTSSMVGARAAALQLEVLAPARLREPSAIDEIRALRPELMVLADYGQIVPPSLLDLPRLGALNLHPSLLPRHRGATPVPAAILAGDPTTGVSLMRMDEGLDTGPLIAAREVSLRGDETAPALEAGLAGVAADLLASSVPLWLRGEIEAVGQADVGASLTRPLRRGDGWLDPRRSAASAERQIRAYQPWPGSFMETDAGRLTVWQGRVVDVPHPSVEPGQMPGAATPGTLVAAGRGLGMVTADGVLELVEVQPAGGRRMSGSAFARGRPSLIGSRVRKGTVG